MEFEEVKKVGTLLAPLVSPSPPHSISDILLSTPEMGQLPLQWGVVILLGTSYHGKIVKLRPCRLPWLVCTFSILEKRWIVLFPKKRLLFTWFLFFPKFMMLSITIEKTHVMSNAVCCMTLFFVAKLMVSCVMFYSIVLYNVRNDNM